jgi:hypothetical protein
MCPPILPILNRANIIPIFPVVAVSFSLLRLSFPRVPFHSGFPTKIFYVFLILPHAFYTTGYPIVLDYQPNNISSQSQIMESTLYNLLHFTATFSSLGSSILLTSHDTFNLRSWTETLRERSIHHPYMICHLTLHFELAKQREMKHK